MGHARSIIDAMADFKCEFCGWRIGKEQAGARVHVQCVPKQYEEELKKIEVRKEPRRGHEE